MGNRIKTQRKSRNDILSYLKDYRFNSMFIKFLMVSILLIAIPVTILNLIYGKQMTASEQKEICSINDTALDRSKNMMDNILTVLRHVTYSFATQERVVSMATDAGVTSLTPYSEFQTIMDTNKLVMNTYSYLNSIYIYFEKSNIIVSDNNVIRKDNFHDLSWAADYKALSSKNYVFQSRSKTNEWPYLITMMFPIRNTSGAVNGAVVLNIDVRQLGRTLGTGSYRSKGEPILLMFDCESESLLYSDESRLLHDEKDDLLSLRPFWQGQVGSASEFTKLWGEQYVISRTFSEDGTIAYCYLTPLAFFYSQSTRTSTFVRNGLILSIFLAIIIAGILSIWAYRPIKSLLAVAEQAPIGRIVGKQQKTNEVSQIKKYMLDTQKQNTNLKNEINERILSLHNAQVSALQSQINPHFLYNTLEAIGDTIIMLVGHENEASNMTLILAQLLRNSLSAENFLVPLREELEHVQLYMKLINFRYPDILLKIDVPSELLEFSVVKLSLQPLIENAIEHGLRPKRCRGKIEIRAEKRDNGLHIRICDDGVGVNEDDMVQLNQRFAEMRFQELQHIGLRNVNQRIRLIYGEASGLKIANSSYGGTEISIIYEKRNYI